MVALAALHVCVSTSKSCAGGRNLLDVLVPTIVGALLGFGGAWVLRGSERRWQADRERFALQLQVVQPLDEALVQTQKAVAGSEIDWQAAIDAWMDGWIRFAPRLDDNELDDRYGAVGFVLQELQDPVNQEPSALAARQITMRAIGGARLAVAHWTRGQPLPERSFPSVQEARTLLAAGDPHPFAPDAPFRTWLTEHPQPNWRPPPPH